MLQIHSFCDWLFFILSFVHCYKLYTHSKAGTLIHRQYTWAILSSVFLPWFFFVSYSQWYWQLYAFSLFKGKWISACSMLISWSHRWKLGGWPFFDHALCCRGGSLWLFHGKLPFPGLLWHVLLHGEMAHVSSGELIGIFINEVVKTEVMITWVGAENLSRRNFKIILIFGQFLENELRTFQPILGARQIFQFWFSVTFSPNKNMRVLIILITHRLIYMTGTNILVTSLYCAMFSLFYLHF